MGMVMFASIAIAFPPIHDMSEQAGIEPDSGLPAAGRDILLMERVARGDMEAFERLVESHQARVIGTIVKMLGDETEAEDIAQQVFIRVWHSAARYKPTAKFTTWLFKITRNLVFNEVRRRRRHPVTPLERETGDRHVQVPDPAAKAPDATVLDGEMQAAIQQAIDSLPESQRLAIVLRRYEEMPYEEIGAVLKLSVPAVKSLLFRARTELREKLKVYLSEPASSPLRCDISGLAGK
jgi:RNA polymerase sigma-70 factor (ECF subfamily)